MGFAIFIFVLATAGLLAILHFGYEEVERERSTHAATPVGHQPAPRQRSADEEVSFLERQIETDLREIAAVVRRAAAGPSRA